MFHEDPGPAGPLLGAHGSLAVEIDWALTAAHQMGRSHHPLLNDLYFGDPDLADQVRRLWDPDETLSYPGHLELSIMAHHGGMLFSTDSDAFLGRLEEMCSLPHRDLALRSETPDDRDRLLRRVEILRSSPNRRRHYVEVLSRVWGALGSAWEVEGLPAVQAGVAGRLALRDRGATWRDFARNDCCEGTTLGGLVEALEPGGEVAVVPAYFTHKGLVVDLPGFVVVGVRMDSSATQARARTEILARQLKSISDPTRLAILDALTREEMTISQIATSFSVSQPTVSNHIKLLREAGVVSATEDGRSRRLAVQPDAVAEILENLQGVLGVQPAHASD
jgi:ArsR family transcriptional regulator, arsenate/arsenite/antimonite-responsive transcriptional repressor